MSEDVGGAAVALSRIRWGHRLLGGYLAASLGVLLVLGLILHWEIFLVTVVAWVLGCGLLAAVSAANVRALGPLRQRARELPGVPQSHDFQPGAGASGLLFLVSLTLVAALGILAAHLATASRASTPIRVTVDSCEKHGRSGQVCSAHWQAGGRTVHGQLAWGVTLDPGSAVGGWYDPRRPQAVYSAEAQYLDATTAQSGTCLLVCLAVFLVLYLRYRRFRKPYLAYLGRLADPTRAP